MANQIFKEKQSHHYLVYNELLIGEIAQAKEDWPLMMAHADNALGTVAISASGHDISLRDDGGVKVINRGFSAEDNAWEQAEGKAYFVGDSNTGALKVSFFGPFYGSYNVARLSDDYSMALVIGPSLDYAWLLSRSKTPAQTQCDAFMQTATDLGIKPESWIWLQQCGTE